MESGQVRTIMQPFAEVASTVRDNQRTAYTEAGGRKIGRSKDDAEWLWVDTHSSIKTAQINAVFGCQIKRPGEDPEFRLYVDGVRVHSYNADGPTDALEEWRAITTIA